MANLEYKMYEKNEIKGKNYVELRLGRQRKKGFKATSIFYTYEVFKMIEGTVWAKYREYSPDGASPISSTEWNRIIPELNKTVSALDAIANDKDLKILLRVRSHIDLPTFEDLESFKSEIKSLLTNLVAWLTPNIKDEEFITICA